MMHCWHIRVYSRRHKSRLSVCDCPINIAQGALVAIPYILVSRGEDHTSTWIDTLKFTCQQRILFREKFIVARALCDSSRIILVINFQHAMDLL